LSLLLTLCYFGTGPKNFKVAYWKSHFEIAIRPMRSSECHRAQGVRCVCHTLK